MNLNWIVKLPKEWKSPQIRVTEKRKGGASQGTKESARGRILFELLDVALLDLLHEALTFEDVTTKIGGKLPRHYENLIVCDFRKRNRTACGNQVRAPLEDQPRVPQNKEKHERSGCNKCPAHRAEESSDPLKEERKAENEDGREGDKEAIPEGGHPVPVGIARDQVIKCGAAHA